MFTVPDILPAHTFVYKQRTIKFLISVAVGPKKNVGDDIML